MDWCIRTSVVLKLNQDTFKWEAKHYFLTENNFSTESKYQDKYNFYTSSDQD